MPRALVLWSLSLGVCGCWTVVVEPAPPQSGSVAHAEDAGDPPGAHPLPTAAASQQGSAPLPDQPHNTSLVPNVVEVPASVIAERSAKAEALEQAALARRPREVTFNDCAATCKVYFEWHVGDALIKRREASTCYDPPVMRDEIYEADSMVRQTLFAIGPNEWERVAKGLEPRTHIEMGHVLYDLQGQVIDRKNSTFPRTAAEVL